MEKHERPLNGRGSFWVVNYFNKILKFKVMTGRLYCIWSQNLSNVFVWLLFHLKLNEPTALTLKMKSRKYWLYVWQIDCLLFTMNTMFVCFLLQAMLLSKMDSICCLEEMQEFSACGRSMISNSSSLTQDVMLEYARWLCHMTKGSTHEDTN